MTELFVVSLKKSSVQDILAHLLEQIGQTPEAVDQPNIHRYVWSRDLLSFYNTKQKDRPHNEQRSNIDGGEQLSSIDDQGGEQSSSIDVKISVTLSFYMILTSCKSPRHSSSTPPNVYESSISSNFTSLSFITPTSYTFLPTWSKTRNILVWQIHFT